MLNGCFSAFCFEAAKIGKKKISCFKKVKKSEKMLDKGLLASDSVVFVVEVTQNLFQSGFCAHFHLS